MASFVQKIMNISAFKFIYIALGIIGAYTVVGIFQEKIAKTKYGPNAEKFEYEMTLIGIQCIWFTIFAKILLTIQPEKKEKQIDNTPISYYIAASAFYVGAMVTSIVALRFIPFPTQVIGKSAKPIPVMLLGVLIARKKYSIQRYFFVLIIVTGVILFQMKDLQKAKEMSFGFGECLLIASLLMDGLLGSVQDRMRAASFKPTGRQMMYSMNLWSSIFMIIGVFVNRLEIIKFFEFATKFPNVLYQIMFVALAGSVGQYFIFSMISEFGPLPNSIVTTTRKFFTVLFSILLFGNKMTLLQWIGSALIFAALFADAFFGKKPLPCQAQKHHSSMQTETPQLETAPSETSHKVDMDVNQDIFKTKL